jgi:hypothetical protein
LLQQAPFSSFAGVNLLSYYGEKGYGKSPFLKTARIRRDSHFRLLFLWRLRNWRR